MSIDMKGIRVLFRCTDRYVDGGFPIAECEFAGEWYIWANHANFQSKHRPIGKLLYYGQIYGKSWLACGFSPAVLAKNNICIYLFLSIYGKVEHQPIGSMYAIYGNIYHQYTPNVSIYTSTMDPMGN